MRPLLCHLVCLLLTALLPCAALATEPPAVQLLGHLACLVGAIGQ